jgi:hypothetical protein
VFRDVVRKSALQTGVAGLPGLLAQGGAVVGGLPISRPDLHFLYNLIETVPLVLGFFQQVRGYQSADFKFASFRNSSGSTICPS